MHAHVVFGLFTWRSLKNLVQGPLKMIDESFGVLGTGDEQIVCTHNDDHQLLSHIAMPFSKSGRLVYHPLSRASRACISDFLLL